MPPLLLVAIAATRAAAAIINTLRYIEIRYAITLLRHAMLLRQRFHERQNVLLF